MLLVYHFADSFVKFTAATIIVLFRTFIAVLPLAFRTFITFPEVGFVEDVIVATVALRSAMAPEVTAIAADLNFVAEEVVENFITAGRQITSKSWGAVLDLQPPYTCHLTRVSEKRAV